MAVPGGSGRPLPLPLLVVAEQLVSAADTTAIAAPATNLIPPPMGFIAENSSKVTSRS